MEWIRRIGRALKIIFEVKGSIQRGFEEDQKLNEESQNIPPESSNECERRKLHERAVSEYQEASKLAHQIRNRAMSYLQKIDKIYKILGVNIKIRQSIDFEDWDMRSHGVDINVFVSRKANSVIMFENGFFYVYPADVYSDMIKLGKISDNIESIKDRIESQCVSTNQRLIEDLKRINDQIKTISEKYKQKRGGEPNMSTNYEQEAKALLLGEVVR